MFSKTTLLQQVTIYLEKGWYLNPCKVLEDAANPTLMSEDQPNINTWKVTGISIVAGIIMVTITNECPYTYQDSSTAIIELDLITDAINVNAPIVLPSVFNEEKVLDFAPIIQE